MNILTLNQILKDCRHLKRLILREARIDVNGKVDFGTNLDYHIEYLSLAYSGRDDHSDWKENLQEFVEIIKGIKGSGLDDSLRWLNIQGCQIDYTWARELLDSDEIGLSHVKIVQEDPFPSGFIN